MIGFSLGESRKVTVAWLFCSRPCSRVIGTKDQIRSHVEVQNGKQQRDVLLVLMSVPLPLNAVLPNSLFLQGQFCSRQCEDAFATKNFLHQKLTFRRITRRKLPFAFGLLVLFPCKQMKIYCPHIFRWNLSAPLRWSNALWDC